MKSIFKRTPKHPAVVIFVRHAATCDHKQDEAYRNCRCVKWARWSMAGQHKESTGTRSWTQAEEWRQRKQKRLHAQCAARRASDGRIRRPRDNAGNKGREGPPQAQAIHGS